MKIRKNYKKINKTMTNIALITRDEIVDARNQLSKIEDADVDAVIQQLDSCISNLTETFTPKPAEFYDDIFKF